VKTKASNDFILVSLFVLEDVLFVRIIEVKVKEEDKLALWLLFLKV
jgi:hypothetical protein